MYHVLLKFLFRFVFALVVAGVGINFGQSVVHAQKVQNNVKNVKSSDGTLIAYEVRGSGKPALIFVHGWSCDRSYWAGQFEHFSRKFKVVAIDLAGHGDSGLGRQAMTMESFGEDVAAVVKKLGLKQVILIGHSMGGDVVAEAARRLPGRVEGIVWLDTYKQLGVGRTPEQVKEFVGTFRPNFKDRTKDIVRSLFLPDSDKTLVERIADDMSSAPPEVALSALESAFSYSRTMPLSLKELKLRVIAINPDNEPTDVASMKRHGIEVIIMPKVGHFLHMEDVERFNGVLMTAIDKLKR